MSLLKVELPAMKLVKPKFRFKLAADSRPLMPEPPPVRLVAIEDVHLPSSAGLEVQLDDFYVNLFRFEREGAEQGHLIYKAENFRLSFDVMEPPLDRDDLRIIGIDVPSLALLEKQLIDRKIEYEWQRGLVAGQSTLLFQDPAGNWVQVGEMKTV